MESQITSNDLNIRVLLLMHRWQLSFRGQTDFSTGNFSLKASHKADVPWPLLSDVKQHPIGWPTPFYKLGIHEPLIMLEKYLHPAVKWKHAIDRRDSVMGWAGLPLSQRRQTHPDMWPFIVCQSSSVPRVEPDLQSSYIIRTVCVF
jgi:hypothetical protein